MVVAVCWVLACAGSGAQWRERGAGRYDVRGCRGPPVHRNAGMGMVWACVCVWAWVWVWKKNIVMVS